MTLDNQINETFVKQRHGITTEVVLLEVRKNKKVVVKCPEREDSFTLPIAEFEKYYQLKKTA